MKFIEKAVLTHLTRRMGELMYSFSLHSSGKIHSEKLFGRFDLGMRHSYQAGFLVADHLLVLVVPETDDVVRKERSLSQIPLNWQLRTDNWRLSHSLQTGKYVASVHASDAFPQLVNFWFQFPSNGKVGSKTTCTESTRWHPRVSIPFKRESR